MKIRSSWRRAVSFLAVGALLFAQAAVAAHLCAGPSGAAPASAMHGATAPCHSSDHPRPPSCVLHCEDGSQNLKQWPAFAFVAPSIPALFVIVSSADAVIEVSMAADPSLAHATSPPLTIRNCCFRN